MTWAIKFIFFVSLASRRPLCTYPATAKEQEDDYHSDVRSRSRRDNGESALCPAGTFLKNLFYCVKQCPEGYYGDTRVNKCIKCAKECNTCENGDRDSLCTSCRSPLYLKETSCVESCGKSFKKMAPVAQLRLRGGKNKFEGRVEIMHDGVWGTICDDDWDVNDANVVCRELLLGLAWEAVKMGRLGEGTVTQPIWLTELKCHGNETWLGNCQHAGWRNHACGHFEDAGVRCTGPDTTRECVTRCGVGYYELPGQQDCQVCSAECFTCDKKATNCTSCDRGRFLKEGNKCVLNCGEGSYGDTSDRKCKLCDPNCRACADGTSSKMCRSCSDSRYLNGSSCVDSCGLLLVAQPRRIRLAGSRTSDYEGRVEVLRNGGWHTVCDQTFDFREATVFCRELGLGAALKAVKGPAYGRGFGRLWSDRLNCTGRERSIFNCPLDRVLWTSVCYHSNDVGVQCAGPQHGSPVSNRCTKKCDSGWYKNARDVCTPCAGQCAECIGSGYRCTGCNAPKFRNKTECIDKCGVAEYGNTVTRECNKCNADICLTCANGPDGNNCTSCKGPLALKSGKCEASCGPDLYRKDGRCVSDCGISFYNYSANYSCLSCPSDCLTCDYKAGQIKCVTCRPPSVVEGESKGCVANCSAGKLAVPLTSVHVDISPNIRLSNGSDYLEGVLEVFHGGVWGTVCDDGWDSKEAEVVCRELNLGSPVYKSLGHIRKGTGKIWLDDLFCSGKEKHFFDCRHRPWGEGNCNHEEDVLLRCTGPGIRECQDTCPEGFYARGNGCFHCNASCKACIGQSDNCTICAAGYYRNGSSCVAQCPATFFLDLERVACQACNSTCATCSISKDNCTGCAKPRYRVGSTCILNCPSGFRRTKHPMVRLMDGKTPLEGRVEIFHNGKYGTICDDSFDIKDANVVCSMLDMGNATHAVPRAFFGRGKDPIWLDELQCKGSEPSLEFCLSPGWGRENCDHSEDAGVRCMGPDRTRDCLADCGTGYYIDADGACGKCSYKCQRCVGLPYNCSSCPTGQFLNATGNVSSCVVICDEGNFGDAMSNKCTPCDPVCYDCDRSKSNCTSCKAGSFLQSNQCKGSCDEGYNVISGVEDIRLAGANSTYEGRVEILHEGVWGTVCDDNWDIEDAKVVCRQLRMGKAVEARGGSKYGRGSGKIFMDDVECKGTERKLQYCKMHRNGIGYSNCGHSEDASVKCTGPDQSKRCVKKCADGYYAKNNKHCEKCNPSCLTCLEKNVCSNCEAPFFLDFTKCVAECPEGEYGNTKLLKCEPCHSSCQTCMDGENKENCRSCHKGEFLKNLKCVTECGEMRSLSSLLPSNPPSPLVRLLGSKDKREGRVEVFHEGEWGTVCDDGWLLKDATIVCKELGFGKALEAPLHSRFGKGSGLIWMDNVNCLGYESSLTQCKHNGWGLGNCDVDHREDASVVCDNTTVESLSNNYCRYVNNGSCADASFCDVQSEVTCVDLDAFNGGIKESVCLQCPEGTTGDGRVCRVISSKLPKFDKSPSNVTVKAQHAIRLECRSQAPIVIPSVRHWRKDEQPFSEADIKSNRITSSNGQLVVHSARLEDAGIYTCILTNSFGSVKNSSQVIVHEPPRILEVTSVSVSIGEAAVLNCAVSSFPRSNITWLRDGKELLGPRYQFMEEKFKYSLKILNVIAGDAGQYECNLINEFGQAVANATLEVSSELKFVTVPNNQTAGKGASVTFVCEAQGVPSPTIVWKKNGERVTNDDRHDIESNSLKISSVMEDDVGVYACVAWNRDYVKTSTARLILLGALVFDIVPEDLSVLSGASVKFYCQALGNPEASYTWLKDFELLKFSKRIASSPSQDEITLDKVTPVDAGTYTCVAKNRFAVLEKSATLTVDGLSAPVVAMKKTQEKNGIGLGKIVGIVVSLLVVLIIIVALVLYKYCRSRRQSEYTNDSSSGRLSALRTKVRAAMQPGIHYVQEKDQVDLFDDSKPFVDHDEL